ncbi:hypothetical protein NUV25_02830 [Burkholderia pseudomultivorans]|uniref:hypothetical protein n=1 Tax=Burkholderia pseudomultivorans TaxID=1207504 RepID=UPI0028770B40|nr:hypothetical protein [Burkholderia pseudomultivorans]MDS0856632.1 hypothetical protein [Burkholderia pseudomultivorans]
MGGKYVTRYFEENAKKYRESPDKTGDLMGPDWAAAYGKAGANRRIFAPGCSRQAEKYRAGPDGSTTRCGDCIG